MTQVSMCNFVLKLHLLHQRKHLRIKQIREVLKSVVRLFKTTPNASPLETRTCLGVKGVAPWACDVSHHTPGGGSPESKTDPSHEIVRLTSREATSAPFPKPSRKGLDVRHALGAFLWP